MLNTWQPNNTSSTAIDASVLNRFAELGQSILQGSVQLTKVVSSEDAAKAQGWLKLSEANWQATLEQLEQTSLYPLAAFFTVAEMQFSGWQCGSKNPAIWIFRWLKKQQQQLSKEQVQALKKLTDNRFIPYGSAL